MKTSPTLSTSVCEEKNYRKVYNDQSKNLRNFLYYKCGDINKAEDMVQDAFITLWNNCKTVIIEKAKSYLFTVGNRLFLNDYQHQKVALNFEKIQTPKSQNETPEYILEEKEFKIQLEEAISNLTEGQREVFLMNRIDKTPFKEIAGKLELSVKAVEKRMHNALINLKKNLVELENHKI